MADKKKKLETKSPGVAASPIPRANPFDSHLSTDRLRFPIVSPSVFSTVQSPGEEKNSTTFWSLENRAELFPAKISDDSPWKQETATSVLDPEVENQTQEAIEQYFSNHHKIESPEGLSSAEQRQFLNSSTDLGSPILPVSSSRRLSYSSKCNKTESPEESPSSVRRQLLNSYPADLGSPILPVSSSRRILSPSPVSKPSKVTTSQSVQTELTLPPILPSEVETVLSVPGPSGAMGDHHLNQPAIAIKSTIRFNRFFATETAQTGRFPHHMEDKLCTVHNSNRETWLSVRHKQLEVMTEDIVKSRFDCTKNCL